MIAATELKDFLDQKVIQYNTPTFLDTDPLGIPHQFNQKEDIELSALLVATIAWGQRKSIIQNGNKLMELLDNAPYEFITSHTQRDLQRFSKFVHRTFNADDVIFFITNLQRLLLEYKNLENVFCNTLNSSNTGFDAIQLYRDRMLLHEPTNRAKKHMSNPAQNASSKRLNMFLRWMVRDAKTGVDFGIWKKLTPAQLLMPLDVHTGNVGRALGLLTRKQDDRKAVEELTDALRDFDAADPVKYDFALFGLGVFEQFAG